MDRIRTTDGHRRVTPVAPVDVRWVADDRSFADVIEQLRRVDAYAIDTEFHRERTYYPRVALVQLAWEDQVALVDPLATSLAPLAEVLKGPGVAVIHAADQDLEVLDLACGVVPTRLFDTQLAAGFVGQGVLSLSALVERELGVRLPKGDRLTDWLRRPLDGPQRDYAAADVAYLLDLHVKLSEELEARGRLGWALDECEALRVRSRAACEPDLAWLRIKECRHLSGRAMGVAKAVAAWRERRAEARDLPTRFVLPDLAVVGIAQRAPADAEQLGRIRGVEPRHHQGRAAAEILEAVQLGLRSHAQRPEPNHRRELDRRIRPAVTLVSAWLSQMGRDLAIETSLLGTRADIEALLSGQDTARLAQGWRAELVGEPIRRLVAGEAALAFAAGADGVLVLEQRSHRRL